jgi:hypothetical protein
VADTAAVVADTAVIAEPRDTCLSPNHDANRAGATPALLLGWRPRF